MEEHLLRLALVVFTPGRRIRLERSVFADIVLGDRAHRVDDDAARQACEETAQRQVGRLLRREPVGVRDGAHVDRLREVLELERRHGRRTRTSP